MGLTPVPEGADEGAVYQTFRLFDRPSRGAHDSDRHQPEIHSRRFAEGRRQSERDLCRLGSRSPLGRCFWGPDETTDGLFAARDAKTDLGRIAAHDSAEALGEDTTFRCLGRGEGPLPSSQSRGDDLGEGLAPWTMDCAAQARPDELGGPLDGGGSPSVVSLARSSCEDQNLDFTNQINNFDGYRGVELEVDESLPNPLGSAPRCPDGGPSAGTSATERLEQNDELGLEGELGRDGLLGESQDFAA